MFGSERVGTPSIHSRMLKALAANLVLFEEMATDMPVLLACSESLALDMACGGFWSHW
jgi:hypothetical protein